MNAPAQAPQPAAKGAIYDLGYARYAGERRPPSTLWRVIMRQQLAHAWKTLWRFKLWLLAAVVTTIVVGVFVYVKQTQFMHNMQRGGAPVGILDGVLVYGYRFYVWSAFFVTLTVVAPVIARDLETGAFTFYFARPVRARDYVVGKLAAIAILMSTIFLAGPLLLCALRLAMARDTAELAALWTWVPKTVAIGVLSTIAYTALPLAASAVTQRRTIALGLWAAYYVVFTTMIVGIGMITWKPLTAIDPGHAVNSLVVEMFDLGFADRGDLPAAPVWAAVGSLLIQSALAVLIVYRQVRAQALGSVGGSS